MSRVIALDSGPLSMLAQRAGVADADELRHRLAACEGRGDRLVIPEIADYEVRRELLRAGKAASVARLDALAATATVLYLPVRTSAIRLAAQLWADARRKGLPTASPEALDGDVILAAQLLDAGFPASDLVVATTNVGHLSRFVAAMPWKDLV